MEEKEDKRSKPDSVKWFKELNRDSGKYAGGKGANLAEIYNLGIDVPPGFVVTAQAYDYFIEEAGIKEQVFEILDSIKYEDTEDLNEKTKEVRRLIVKTDFPKEMKVEILEAYEHLGAVAFDSQSSEAIDILKTSSEPIFVAVRSSATAEDLADASFAGQQDTYLNIKGNSDLLDKVKKCFASLFTSRATYYRHKKGFKHDQVSLAVVVQKMIDANKSGVIFSKDPTYKSEDTIIEAVWGLGEGIVSGRVTPDKYVVSKDLEIVDKKIKNKKVAITRNSAGEKEVVKLNEDKAKSQVLKNHEIKKLAEIANKLEKHYDKPQDIEFAIEGSEVYIVQTRPITTLEKRIEKGGREEIEGEPVLEGLAASPGIAVGKVKVVDSLEDLHKVQKGDILVTGMTNPDMVVTMQRSSGIVTDEGGMTAHAAIVSREMGIPCVVGTDTATSTLKDGEIITIDGYSGKIYQGEVAESEKKEVQEVTAQTKTKIKVIVDLPSFAERASKTGIKKVGLTRVEGIIAESGKHPNYFLTKGNVQEYEDIIYDGISGIAKYFDEVWVRTSDVRSDEYQNLEGAPKQTEANPMLGMHGIRFGIKHPKIIKAEMKALQRVAQENKKVGLLFPQVISVEELKKMKEFRSELNFNNAKLGIMIETPASIQIINELCSEGIDFISFGTNDLTQYMLALDRGNQAVQHLYDEMHPAILKQLEYVIRVCKRNKVETSICGQAGSRKEMAKFLVEAGIDSISVNADMAKEISDYVAEIEKNLQEKKGELPRQYQPNKFKKFHKKQFKKNEYYEKNKERIDRDLEALEKEKMECIRKDKKDGGYKQGNEKCLEALEKEKQEYLKKENL